MNLSQELKSLLFIVGGTVLLVFGAGEILFKLLLAIIGIMLMVYGLQLRRSHQHGQGPFSFIMREWFFRR